MQLQELLGQCLSIVSLRPLMIMPILDVGDCTEAKGGSARDDVVTVG